MPTEATQKEIIDSVFAAFPTTPLTIGQDAGDPVVQPYDMVAYSVNKGRCGWRADSWGRYIPVNFMARYRKTAAQIPNAWQQGPVVFEKGGSFSGNQPFDSVDKTVSLALEWHASLVSNWSRVLPSIYFPKIKPFLKKVGFRLVVQEATYDNAARPGANIPIAMNWVNRGVAPPYRDLRIAFRLKNTTGQTSAVVITSQSVKGWLPGAKPVTVNYALPPTVANGTYTLETALVFHNAVDRVTAIAIKGKTGDGWYPLGSIAIGGSPVSARRQAQPLSPQYKIRTQTLLIAGVSGQLQVTLRDLSGKIVLKRTLITGTAGTAIQLNDRKQLTSGIYLVCCRQLETAEVREPLSAIGTMVVP
jgi:hypothetical protein